MSTDTAAPPAASRSITGTTRPASSPAHTGCAPGRVDSPFGHDGKVALLAGGLNWFAAVELLTVEGNRRVASELVPV
ncbi:MAG: hypothetical protein ABIP91_02275, partial [Sphingomicrobium sp.]